MSKLLVFEIWDFLKVRKAWWLLPVLITLLLVAFLVIVTQNTAVSPFIYALF